MESKSIVNQEAKSVESDGGIDKIRATKQVRQGEGECRASEDEWERTVLYNLLAIDHELRRRVTSQWHSSGIAAMAQEARTKDCPIFY